MTRPTAGRASMPWAAFASAFLAHLSPAEQLDARARLRQAAILRGSTLNPEAACRLLGITPQPPRPAPQPHQQRPAPQAQAKAQPQQRTIQQLLDAPTADIPSTQEDATLRRYFARQRLQQNGYRIGQSL